MKLFLLQNRVNWEDRNAKSSISRFKICLAFFVICLYFSLLLNALIIFSWPTQIFNKIYTVFIQFEVLDVSCEISIYSGQCTCTERYINSRIANSKSLHEINETFLSFSTILTIIFLIA